MSDAAPPPPLHPWHGPDPRPPAPFDPCMHAYSPSQLPHVYLLHLSPLPLLSICPPPCCRCRCPSVFPLAFSCTSLPAPPCKHLSSTFRSRRRGGAALWRPPSTARCSAHSRHTRKGVGGAKVLQSPAARSPPSQCHIINGQRTHQKHKAHLQATWLPSNTHTTMLRLQGAARLHDSSPRL